MATVIISNLPPISGTGIPQGTDWTPATDTTDTTESNSGTTKKYARWAELNFNLTAMGLTPYTAVKAASTTTLTATYTNGSLGVGATLTNAGAQVALTLDDVILAVADRVLIKNQASTFQNGIYVVTAIGSESTNWVLTRATDFNEAADVIQYGVVLVNAGTESAGLLYQESGAGPFIIGTTPITFVEYSTVSSISGVASITGTANQVIASAAVGAVTLSLPQDIATTSAVTFGRLNVDNLRLDGNTISSTDTNGNINLLPNGTGSILGGDSSVFWYTGGTEALQMTAINDSANFVAGSFVNTAGNAPKFDAYKSRSTAPGAFVAVQSDDEILRIRAFGDDGTQFSQVGGMLVKAVGTISAGVVPGQLQLFTANAAGAITTALTINNAQVVSLTNALPVTSGGTGTTTSTGSGSVVRATSPTLTTPVLGTATATSLSFSSTSGIIGTTTNNSAAAGSVGEYIESVVLAAAATSVTTVSAENLTSISLTAGDWDVWGNITFLPASTTSVNSTFAWISSVSATIPDDSLICGSSYGSTPIVSSGSDMCVTVVQRRFSLSAPTTIYISNYCAFTVSTMTKCGGIYARRAR